MGNFSMQIDVTKIVKEHLFKSEKTGRIYLNMTGIELKDPQFGQSHMIIQNIPEEKLGKDEQPPILGHIKPIEKKQAKSAPIKEGEGGDDLPF